MVSCLLLSNLSFFEQFATEIYVFAAIISTSFADCHWLFFNSYQLPVLLICCTLSNAMSVLFYYFIYMLAYI